MGKTHNSIKITGEEKCMSETDDVRERDGERERESGLDRAGERKT